MVRIKTVTDGRVITISNKSKNKFLKGTNSPYKEYYKRTCFNREKGEEWLIISILFNSY
jgi:hypothetical protein